ncbi:COQ7-domain-containing protein [Meira miltonrushii]|uniref:5-demethoxyubiquinone hydroxylase, mitochondrial n=1 Tax=Meira miltonrushii TaxID=1280837 RepID=A0A316V511_9BASI|nr:COQ7-domain-containing protein [Meira miltonrushii]PWN32620.1 COQ7-domain-containing protein [Meira miltonrushii]
MIHRQTFATTADFANAATSSSPDTLSELQRNALDSMLRVDHSGEIAANTIYIAQARVFGLLGDQTTSKMCWVLLETEKKHLKVAEKLLMQHRVRPSLLNPIWGIAGSVLGGATALIGKEGAMAATEAVETVIGEHYDDQLKTLSAMTSGSEKVHPSLELLRNIVQEFRDDELEHLDTAVEHDAQQAPAHALLSAIIGFGCKGAIEVAKRF